MTTLPITPDLLAEADVLATEWVDAHTRFMPLIAVPVSKVRATMIAANARVMAGLLADLTRHASMDAARRRLAIRCGIDPDGGLTWTLGMWGIWDLRSVTGAHVGFTADALTAKKFSDPARGIVHHAPGIMAGMNRAEALAVALAVTEPA